MRERERQSDNTVSRIRAKLAARVRVMSRGERAKLDRLLINIELLADAQGAAKHIGLSSKLLHKWMSTPEIRWVIDQAIPRFLSDGTFLGYIGSVIDIHDRKLSEEKQICKLMTMGNR